MQRPLTFITILLSVFLCSCSLATAGNKVGQGQVDFSQLDGLQGLEPEVNITLNGWLLSLAKVATDESDDKDLQWMKGLDSMRVKIYQLCSLVKSLLIYFKRQNRICYYLRE